VQCLQKRWKIFNYRRGLSPKSELYIKIESRRSEDRDYINVVLIRKPEEKRPFGRRRRMDNSEDIIARRCALDLSGSG
jgi:hypothetical protein